MALRTRLKRLEDLAKRAAPKEDDRCRREASQRMLDGMPLELLLRIREAMHEHLLATGKADDPHAHVCIGDLDLGDDLRLQLTAYLSAQREPAGSAGCYQPPEDRTGRAPA